MHTKFWLENWKGRDHLEGIGIEGYYRNKVGGCGSDSSGSG